jgi:hypothetical protein
MWPKIVLFLLVNSVVANDLSFAQETYVNESPDHDQVIDSTHQYGNIESYSGSSRFTRFMYRLFYKPVDIRGGK